MFISFFSFSQDKKRLALVVGNSNYDSIAKLANPVNDAKLIAKTLDSLEFEVILATDLDEEGFMTKIIEFRDKRKNYDVGFVYYAGHGIQIDGENYLLPVNKNFDQKWKVKKDAINVNDVMDYLTASTDEVNILILDACRNNPWEGGFRSVGGSNNGGLAKIPAPTGSLIAFSTNAGAVAADGDGENSMYCKSLVKNMLKKNTTLDQVFRNVRTDVLKKSNNAQRPIESSQLTGEAFYLLKTNYIELFEKAQAFYDDEKYLKALEIINQSIPFDKNNRLAYQLKAQSYNKLKKPKEAQLNWEKTIEIDPDFSKGYYNLGSLGDYSLEKRIEYILKSIDLENNQENKDYSLLAYAFSEIRKLYTELDLIDEYMNLLETNDSLYKGQWLEQNLYFNKALAFPQKKYKEKLLNYRKVLEFNYPISKFKYYKNIYFSTYYNIADIYRHDLKDYENAIDNYNLAISKDSTNIKAYKSIAEIYSSELEDNTNAINYYSKAIAVEPNNANLYYKRAGLKNASASLDDFSIAIELDSENIDYYTDRAQALLVTNQYNLALVDLLKYLEIKPTGSSWVFRKLGSIYSKNFEDYVEAEKYYNKAIELNSEDYLGYSNRAYFYENFLNDYDKALKDYTKSVSLDSKNEEQYYFRARFYRKVLKNYDKALIDLDKAININPNYVDAYYEKTFLYFDLKDYDSVLPALLKLIEIEENDGGFASRTTYNNIGNRYRNRAYNSVTKNYLDSDSNLAIEYFKKSIAVDSMYTTALYNLAVTYEYNFDDKKTAEKYYDKAIQVAESLDKDNESLFRISKPYLNKAMFNQRRYDYKNAIKNYNKAAEINNKEWAAYYGIGNMLSTESVYMNNDGVKTDHLNAIYNYNKAITAIEKNKVALSSSEFIRVKSMVYRKMATVLYLKLELYDKAIEYYNKATEVNPQDYLSYLYKSDIYSEQFDDNDKAIKELSTIISFDLSNKNIDMSKVYYERAQIYDLHLNDFGKALKDYSKAIELHNSRSAWDLDNMFIKRNESYEKLEKFDIAISEWNNYLNLYPKHKSYVDFKIGKIYFEDKNNLPLAISYFTKSLEDNNWKSDKIDSQASETLRLRSSAYFNNNELSKAIKDINDAIRINNEDYSLSLFTKKLYYLVAANELNNAKRIVDIINFNDNKNPEPYYYNAYINFQQANYLESYVNISKAIDRLNDSYPISFNNKKIALDDLNNFKEEIIKKLNK